MTFPTMQRLTGHDNTPDAPGQATSTGDSLAGRPAGVMVVFRSGTGTAAGCWLAFSSYEEEKDVVRISGWVVAGVLVGKVDNDNMFSRRITLPRGSLFVAQLI